MSEDPADFEKRIIASEKRFEIFVPKPEARINLGAPAAKKHPDGPFAHPGVSISAKDHLFAQSAKEMVIQSGKDTNFLVGGSLGHYTKEDVQLTAGADLRLSAGKRVLVISGAQNDPAMRADHGDALRLQAYNNLAQHYRVDGIEVGLYEFFHGRRDRPRRSPAALARAKHALRAMTSKTKLLPLVPLSTRKRFDHTDPAQTELAKDPELQGGFTGNLLRTLAELYPAEHDGIGDKYEVFFPKNLSRHPNTRAGAQKVTKIPARLGLFPRPASSIPPIAKMVDPSDPRKWIEPLFTHEALEAGAGKKGLAHSILGGKDILELEWGFSRYFSRFDPYKVWKPKAFPGWAARAILTLQNGLVKLRRMLDCLFYTTGAPGALLNKLMEAGATALPPPFAVFAALDATVAAFATVSQTFDQYKKTYSDEDTQNPFAEPALAFAAPFKAQADDRQASIKSLDGPFDLSSKAAWAVEVTTEAGTAVKTSLVLGAIPARPAVLRFTAGALEDVLEDGQVIGSQTVTLALEIDGRSARFTFDSSNAPGAAAVATLLQAALGTTAVVVEADDTITITTSSTGAGSRILVVEYDYEDHVEGDADEGSWTLATGWLERGVGALPPVADPAKVSAAEIAARLSPSPGAVISDVGGALRVSSETKGAGSLIAIGSDLADALFVSKDATPPKRDEVVAKISPDWEEIDSAESLTKPITTWIEWTKGLPDQAQAMFEPVTNACADLLATLEAAESVVEAALAVAGAAEVPEPPESVGIFGTDGITLGTHDRIVGTGGHGILFVVDGASGEADKAKMEGKLEWTARFAGGFAPARPPKKRASLGFRVFSDSLVDLSAANGAQLLAMGRGKAKDNRPHGDKIGGVGVARVLSSWVTEIGGHEKVIISARSKGDPSDTGAATGGRVEVAAQTIAIGGVRIEDKDADGNEYGPFDFDETRTGVEAHKSFGITPLELETVAMAEHLTLQKQPKDKVTGQVKPWPHLKEMSKYAWPKALRKEHPRTERVHVHSEKEAVIVVGPYLIHVAKDTGVQIGFRKANKDPALNELDETKARFVVDARGVTASMPNKDKSEHTGFTLFEGQAIYKGTDGSGDPGMLSLGEGSATLGAGASDSIEISKSDGMKVAVSKLDATASGTIKIKGGQIQIG